MARFRELERRALEVGLDGGKFPYPPPTLFSLCIFQRDEILQARAVTCALPLRKPTTPTKAAGNGDAVKNGKQTTQPGARSPSKGRNQTSVSRDDKVNGDRKTSRC